jgi:hypothetical protein
MNRLGCPGWLLALLVMGCSGAEPSSPRGDLGSLSLALAATGPDGALYRLREAVIDVAGPTPAVVETETDASATVRSLSAAPGNYTITLTPGWRFERVDPTFGNVAVDATLVSANPQQAHVSPAATTRVGLRFTVAGLGDVVLDPGQLDIGIEVGAPSCAPAPQGGCSVGKKCTDFQGNSRCAPDGIVPEGGACVSEGGIDECAAGTLCQQGVCTRICALGSSDCTCSRFGGLFNDNENIGLCVSSCDPIGQDCPAGQGCYLVSAESTQCAPAGTSSVGGSCQFANSCVAGSSCAVQYPDRTEPECAAHCIPGEPCGPNAMCAQIRETTPEEPGFGICIDCVRWPDLCSMT